MADATSNRADRAIVAAGTLLNATLALVMISIAGADRDGTELALRMTARVSFVWFMAAFLASPLRRLWPSRVTARLLQWRRALGITFGLSMAIHVAFILRLYALHAPERPPMVTEADFLVGIPGLVLVGLLTLTSSDAIKRRLGATRWRQLHRTGIWVVWAIFFLCLIDSVGRKTTEHPVLAYYSFIAVLLVSAALRLYVRRVGRHAAL